MPLPRFLDFFAGSGLVSHAVEDHFDVVWANDFCPKKELVYTRNHGKEHFQPGPIEDVDAGELPTAEVSWASFPCQDLSLAGNMEGLGGARSGVFWAWFELMEQMPDTPPIVVLENVAGLITGNNGDDYVALHEALAGAGFRVGAMILDAEKWIPQSRERVFVVGVSEQIDTAQFELDEPGWHHPDRMRKVASRVADFVWWDIPKPPRRRRSLQGMIDRGAPLFEGERRDATLSLIPQRHFDELLDLGDAQLKVATGYKRMREGRQCLELRFDGVAGCIRTPKGGSSRQFLVINDGGDIGVRLLTEREVARLMGAPEGYILADRYNDSYFAMGDAVAVPVVRHLAAHLLNPLADELAVFA